MAVHLDPINEGPETEAFWALVGRAANTVEAMQARGIPPTGQMMEALGTNYRLSYICAHCDNEHRVNGDYTQVSTAVQVLLLQGARSVMVETMAHALLADAVEADAAVEAPSGASEAINKRLQEQFFNRK